MKVTVKKHVFPLLIALAVFLSAVCFGVFFQKSSGYALAQEITSDLKISSTADTYLPGDEVTLEFTFSTKRTDTVWASFDICVGLLNEDGTSFDKDTAKFLAIKTNDAGRRQIEYGKELDDYSKMSYDNFATLGSFRLVIFSDGDEFSADSEAEITIRVPIVIGEGITASELTFGLLPSVSDSVAFGIGASDAKDTPTGKRADGILSFNTVSLRLATLELTEESDYLFLFEEYTNSRRYRRAYTEFDMVHGIDDKDWTCHKVLGNIPYLTTINEFLANINETLYPLLSLYDNYGNIYYDHGKPVDDYTSDVFDNVLYSVGTGWRLEIGTGDTPVDVVYISVLADLDGDGQVTGTDLSVLTSVISGKTTLDSAEYRLAAYITNFGGIGASDTSALSSLIAGRTELSDYVKYVEHSRADERYTVTVYMGKTA